MIEGSPIHGISDKSRKDTMHMSNQCIPVGIWYILQGFEFSSYRHFIGSCFLCCKCIGTQRIPVTIKPCFSCTVGTIVDCTRPGLCISSCNHWFQKNVVSLIL